MSSNLTRLLAITNLNDVDTWRGGGVLHPVTRVIILLPHTHEGWRRSINSRMGVRAGGG